MNKQDFQESFNELFHDRQLVICIFVAVLSSVAIVLFSLVLANNLAYSQLSDKSNSNAGSALTGVAAPDAKSVFNTGMLSYPQLLKASYSIYLTKRIIRLQIIKRLAQIMQITYQLILLFQKEQV